MTRKGFDAEHDPELMRHAVQNAGVNSFERRTRWSHAGAMFGLGSGSASALCRRFGLDPDEVVGRNLVEEDECPTCGVVL